MSIPVLTQVYDEVRRLAIAGSVVAPGDFRLKKLVPQLEQAGAKAPVFAKVGEAAKRLVESNEKSSAAALLELTSLMNAILYTQGETGTDGELAAINSIDLGRPTTQASARVLKPLQEALTSTGSGRLEIIQDAIERGAFRDLRLIGPALAALDDGYSEISELVATRILPLYGRAILPELQSKFQPKGKAGHARRLLLMHRLDAEAARPFVQRALEEGSKEIRIAAIECLGDAPDDLPFLLEQAKSRSQDVRTAALKALGNSASDDAVKALCAAIDNADLGLAIEPLRTSRSPAVLNLLLEAAEKQLDALLSGMEKDKKKLGKMNSRLDHVLSCLRGRDDQQTVKFLLKAFERAEALVAVKGEPSGKDTLETLVSVMAATASKAQSALIDAHAGLPADCLETTFLAACRSRTPAEVFELFSPYLTAKVNAKKTREPAYAKRQAIISAITCGSRWWFDDQANHPEESATAAGLDPRWLDLAVKLEQIDLVMALAKPGHTQANEFLARQFEQQLAKTKDVTSVIAVLSAMIRVGHPAASDATIALIKKAAKGSTHFYYGYWIGQLIPRLPKAEALPKLEAILPQLPDKTVDQLLGFVMELKNSP